MHYTILALGIFLMSSPAHAQVAGQPCPSFGTTTLAQDNTDIVACLYTSPYNTASGLPAPSLVWKSRYGGDGGSFVITVNGVNDFQNPTAVFGQAGNCLQGNSRNGGLCSCPGNNAPRLVSIAAVTPNNVGPFYWGSITLNGSTIMANPPNQTVFETFNCD